MGRFQQLQASESRRRRHVEIAVKGIRHQEEAQPSSGSGNPHLRRILVPVDFSECSRKALDYGVSLANQFRSELLLLHVVQPYVPVPELTAVDTELVLNRMMDAARTELARWRESLGKEIAVETQLRVGRPEVEIERTISERKIDLAVLSTHGRTGLKHALLGSTAERVVRHATCPVLVVREHERDFVPPLASSRTDRIRAQSGTLL